MKMTTGTEPGLPGVAAVGCGCALVSLLFFIGKIALIVLIVAACLMLLGIL